MNEVYVRCLYLYDIEMSVVTCWVVRSLSLRKAGVFVSSSWVKQGMKNSFLFHVTKFLLFFFKSVFSFITNLLIHSILSFLLLVLPFLSRASSSASFSRYGRPSFQRLHHHCHQSHKKLSFFLSPAFVVALSCVSF